MNLKRANKKELAKALGIHRSLLYYRHKMQEKDFLLKQEIEKVLCQFPSYGHKRIALKLKANKKRILRVMHIFGIKPYRRRGKKWHKSKKKELEPYPNLLLNEIPKNPSHIWVSDFTHFVWKRKTVYLATVMDLFSREVVGFSVMTNHSVQFVINALLSAVHKHPIAGIIHSDQGSEYLSKDYVELAASLGIRLSMSHVAPP